MQAGGLNTVGHWARIILGKETAEMLPKLGSPSEKPSCRKRPMQACGLNTVEYSAGF